MSEANDTLSDSQVEQIEEMMPSGGFQIMKALVDNGGDGMTVAEIADALGWTEEEVDEILREMEDRGLLGPPPLEERVYVGNTDRTLAEVADEMGRTIEETLEALIGLEEKGLAETVQIGEYEHMIRTTLEGKDAWVEINEHLDAYGEFPGWFTAETSGPRVLAREDDSPSGEA